MSIHANVLSSPRNTNEPSFDEIWKQYRKICADSHFGKAQQVVQLLEYLLKQREAGESVKDFDAGRDGLGLPKKAGKRLGGEISEKQEKSVRSAARQVKAKLAANLALYYSAAGKADPILFEVVTGSFAIDCRYNNGAPSDAVPCQLVGDNHAGIRYVVDRYLADQAGERKLVLIRDTHVRADDKPGRYQDQDYADLQSAFRSFLEHGDHDTVRACLVVGRTVDKQFLKAVQAAGAGHEEKIRSYTLNYPGTLINFAILHYDDNSREVLFGFGQGRAASPGAVFRSDAPGIVREFSNFYDVLTDARISSETPLSALGATPSMNILPCWDQGRFNSMLGEVERNPDDHVDLRIVTTYFINEADIRARLMECLARGVRIRILLMNPDNDALMYGRFGIRKDRITLTKAAERIKDQLEFLDCLADDTREKFGRCEGTLETAVSDLTPSGFAAHCRKWAVLGVMPARESYEEGPMIVADPETSFRNDLDKDARARWAEARSKNAHGPVS